VGGAHRLGCPADHSFEEDLMAAPQSEPTPQRDHERSPWNWLLLVPIVVPLLVPLFNANDPRLFGFPRFYWLQLAFILVGVATTTLVYNMTKRRG
jgi:hypothetical protein